MAGSITWERIVHRGGDISIYKGEWVCDASGDVNGISSPWNIEGYIQYVKTVPDSGGTTPTSYGITFLDADGYDILEAGGAGRSTTAAEVVEPTVQNVFVVDPITPVVTGAGVSKGGTFYLYVMQR